MDNSFTFQAPEDTGRPTPDESALCATFVSRAPKGVNVYLNGAIICLSLCGILV